MNTFFDLLIAFDKGDGESLRVQERSKMLADVLKQLFNQKRLSKNQVKIVFEYAQRTTFRHIALIQLCFSKKRVFVERPVIVTLSEPRMMGNLQKGCKEIIEEKEEASRSQQDFYQADEPGANNED